MYVQRSCFLPIGIPCGCCEDMLRIYQHRYAQREVIPSYPEFDSSSLRLWTRLSLSDRKSALNAPGLRPLQQVYL